MSVVSCQHCGERVFTIAGWGDLDHCPHCGRNIAAENEFARAVRSELDREGRRLKHGAKRAARTDSDDRRTNS